MKNKSDESILNLLIDYQLITNAKQISNYFNNFFTSIAEKINKHCQSKKTPHLLYLGTENKNIFLFPTEPEDIEDVISSMKTRQLIQIVYQSIS